VSPQLVLQLLGSAAVAAVFVAIINGVFNRRKLSAEATAVIARAASGVVERLEQENTRILGNSVALSSRVAVLEAEARQRQSYLLVHEMWDREAVMRLRSVGVQDLTDPPPLNPPTT
jgi:hypothetical protein